jgi:hypothetical protein
VCKQRSEVREEHPLSSLLLVLPANLIKSIVDRARIHAFLSFPIPQNSTQDFPILQYADDTLIIMEGCSQQLVVLKRYVADICRVYWAYDELF